MFKVLLALAITTLDVPFVRQVRAGCGSAAVAMVMQYWVQQQPGLDAVAAEAERIDKALPASQKGIAGRELARYLESSGFRAFIFDGEMADLQSHLEKGRPVIVCLGLKGEKAPLHFVVVVGLEDGSVVLNDPQRGKLVKEPLDRFEAAWKVTKNWALLAVPAK